MDERTDHGEIVSQFTKYVRFGKTFEKALDAVLRGCVKAHKFLPSGRTIYTVVGNGGDEFIDPQKPYCSCSNFFFRVMDGKRECCYHILSHKMALEAGMMEEIVFDDEEYSNFLSIVTLDVISGLVEER